MRILHLVHYYPPDVHGGTQSHVAALARRQIADGHEVRVIAGAAEFDSAGGARESVDDGVTVTRLHREGEAERLSGDLGSERLGRLVERVAVAFSPDVAHVHHWHALTRDLVRRLKTCSGRVIVTLHDLFTTCPRHFRMPDARRFCASDVTLDECARCVAPDVPSLPLAELRDVLATRNRDFQRELEAADVVLTVSAAQRRLLEGISGFTFTRLAVAPIGLDDAPCGTVARRPADGIVRCAHWAGLDPRKGAHMLAAGAASARNRDRLEVHFHGRLGEAAYMDEVRQAGAAARLAFHGPFADADRAAFGRDHDVAVLPFLAFETHGLVVDEALALGLPVIVSDRGAPPDRIGTCGLVVPPGDVQALAAALDRLVDEPDLLDTLRHGTHHARSLAEHCRELMTFYAPP